MGLFNMTVGGPQIIGGGGVGDVTDMNDTIGGLVNTMQSQKKFGNNQGGSYQQQQPVAPPPVQQPKPVS